MISLTQRVALEPREILRTAVRQELRSPLISLRRSVGEGEGLVLAVEDGASRLELSFPDLDAWRDFRQQILARRR